MRRMGKIEKAFDMILSVVTCVASVFIVKNNFSEFTALVFVGIVMGAINHRVTVLEMEKKLEKLEQKQEQPN